ESAEKVIEQEIDRLKKSTVDEQELTKAKNLIEAFFVRILKTGQYRAFMLGYFETNQGDYRELFKETERYRAVTAADLQRVANVYLSPNNRVVVIARATKNGGHGE